MALSDQFGLPDGAIYNGGIGVCQYMASDGTMSFGYVYDTHDLPLSSTLGLLEMAKLDLRERSLSDE